MRVRTSQTVDDSGRVYLPYLTEWTYPNHDTATLLQVVIRDYRSIISPRERLVPLKKVVSIKPPGIYPPTQYFLKDTSHFLGDEDLVRREMPRLLGFELE